MKLSAFKKAVRLVPALSRKQRVRTVKIAAQLDDDSREEFLKEIEEKADQVVEFAEAMENFIKDYTDMLDKAEKNFTKLERRDEEEEEHESQMKEMEQRFSELT